MNNVFLKVKSDFTFKSEPLKKLIANQSNKQIHNYIESFFEQQHTDSLDYANLVRDLLSKVTGKQATEKLLQLLVYFATMIDTDQTLKIFQSIKAINISPIILVKFYSFVFKSVNDNKIKKWLISSSLQAMQKQEKTTPFISFIQNFQAILATVHLDAHQLIDVYWKLISYLEKHLIYKKLVSHYVFVALNLVNKTTISIQNVTKLIVKAIYSDNFEDNVTDILNKESLKSHQLYTILQARITGDITALQKINIWQKYNLEKQRISRKVRIQAIPRLFKNIKQASYAQASQMLGIQKKQVQGYIIQAIRLGIMKAKLDEYQQTIIINKLNLRCLQKGEQVQLQKEISDLCESLERNA